MALNFAKMRQWVCGLYPFARLQGPNSTIFRLLRWGARKARRGTTGGMMTEDKVQRDADEQSKRGKPEGVDQELQPVQVNAEIPHARPPVQGRMPLFRR